MPAHRKRELEIPSHTAAPPLPRPSPVVLVQDRLALIELVTLTLNHGQYEVRTAADADRALALLGEWRPHLVVFDADIDGRRVMEHILGSAVGGAHIPAIGLTRRGDLKNKLALFEWGADDILTIPFAPEELLARVVAVLRRTYSDAVTFTSVVKLGDLEINILNRTVRAGTSELRLTSLEQSLLYLLAANAGRVVTREEILDTLWGVDYVAESNVLDRHIRNLRARLQNDWRKPRFIVTVPGVGYRFLPNLET